MSTTTPDTATKLRQVLTTWANPPAELVATLPKGGAQLAYMGHAAVTRALIEVDPHWTYDLVRDANGVPVVQHLGKRLVVWGTLTVHGKTLPCVGTCEDRKFEPEKELIGDLLRNGAMRFGIGLSLWSKDEWTDLTAPAPFDRVIGPIEQLPDGDRQELRDFCRAHDIRVTRAALTDSQADQLTIWLAERGHT